MVVGASVFYRTPRLRLSLFSGLMRVLFPPSSAMDDDDNNTAINNKNYTVGCHETREPI